jgi:RNA polymerase sigma-70 factor, ECF subfamily
LTADADAAVRAAVDASFREEWGRIVATLIAVTGDWDLAEECAQDAFAQALRTWARDGVPARPGAWLTTSARNRAVDVLRRRANETAKLAQAARLLPEESGDLPEPDPSGIADDRLRLIFTCCSTRATARPRERTCSARTCAPKASGWRACWPG